MCIEAHPPRCRGPTQACVGSSHHAAPWVKGGGLFTLTLSPCMGLLYPGTYAHFQNPFQGRGEPSTEPEASLCRATGDTGLETNVQKSLVMLVTGETTHTEGTCDRCSPDSWG